MKIFFAVMAYTFAVLLPFLTLLWYGRFANALLVFIVACTILGYPIAMLIGVIKVHEARAQRA